MAIYPLMGIVVMGIQIPVDGLMTIPMDIQANF